MKLKSRYSIFSRTALILFFWTIIPVYNPTDAQDKTDKGRVFYQLNYRPGDWITYTMTRYVQCMAFGNHQIFIGTTGGIIRYHYHKKTYDYPLTVSNGLLDNDVRVTAYDQRTGYLYAATRLGFHFWDPYSELMNSVRYSELGFGFEETVLSVGFDINSKVWIQTGKSFYSTFGSLQSLLKDDPEGQNITWHGHLFLLQNPLPNLFVSSSEGSQYDPAGKVFTDRDFNRFPVTCHGYDASGLLWVGTQGAGVWQAETASNLMKPLQYGLYMRNATAMAFDDEFMWIGGSYAKTISSQELTGVTEWNQAKNIFFHHSSTFRKFARFDEMYSILTDSLHIWIGTENGLIQKSKNSDNWTTYGTSSGLFHPAVYSLTRQKNKLFIGTKQGLNYAVQAKNGYEIFKADIPELFNLTIYKMISQQSVLWLATNNGIYAIDEEKEKWYHFNAFGYKVGATTFTREDVKGIAENDSDLFFISGQNVAQFHKTSGEWLSLPVNSEFLNSGVNDAKADRENLWIATCSGVLRLHLKKQKWFYYSEKDGLGNDYVYSILLDGDYIWFGCMEGISQFFWNAPHLKE